MNQVDAAPAHVLPADRLSLLDEVERFAPPAPAPARLVFHDALTKERPPDTLPAVQPRPAAKRAPPAKGKPAARALASAGPVAAAPPPAGRWSVQLGASPRESEAAQIAARHPGARIVAADVDGKRWYRVRLGAFGSRGDAQAALDRLARDARDRGFVTSGP